MSTDPLFDTAALMAAVMRVSGLVSSAVRAGASEGKISASACLSGVRCISAATL